MSDEIQAIERQIAELSQKLAALRQAAPAQAVPDYRFSTTTGELGLSDLFAGRDTLFAIHNMGQGCRYCTLWADGLNGFLPHLESRYSVVLLSKDPPGLQQQFAHARGWRFRMASHGGGVYLQEQAVGGPGAGNSPGLVVYQRQAAGIVRKAAAAFGPGDQYCSLWNILALAGIGVDEFTPQFSYWKRPEALDDGGANLI